VLRLEQALGNARAQTRHRYALVLSAGGADRRGRSSSFRGGRGFRGGFIQIFDDITLGDAAIAARGRNLRRV
jgi:hypothetical protein